VYDVGGDAVLVVLGSKVPADENRFDSEKAALRDRIAQRAETTAVRHFIDQLKAKADIRLGQVASGASS